MVEWFNTLFDSRIFMKINAQASFLCYVVCFPKYFWIFLRVVYG